jgi:DNA polymerase elongation subunit (family B)
LFQGCEATPSVGIADRARHPDELKQDSGNWLIDIDYYISQQVLLDSPAVGSFLNALYLEPPEVFTHQELEVGRSSDVPTICCP